mmetsp:Transcript_12081/g.26434  ORF Transcript_12081/g.26434 Transcript_12081/m.26434 type:complete len:569 (-) Transcript_12081:187-1893(-)
MILNCDKWYHGLCIGVSEAQADRCDNYVCVRCSSLRVYKECAQIADKAAQKWMDNQDLSKSRQLVAQKHNRKVRKEERDIDKKLLEIEEAQSVLAKKLLVDCKNLSSHSTTNGIVIQGNKQESSIVHTEVHGTKFTIPLVDSGVSMNEECSAGEQAAKNTISKASAQLKNCKSRLAHLNHVNEQRIKLYSEEDQVWNILRAWCSKVASYILRPQSNQVANLSKPSRDGTPSKPMEMLTSEAVHLNIIKFPDVANIVNIFYCMAWSLRCVKILSRKPTYVEMESLIAQSSNLKLHDEKSLRSIKSFFQRAQQWQAKVQKVLAPIPGETKKYDVNILNSLVKEAKNIPMSLPEESHLWHTIDDNGARHCFCGGPSDGSFMMGCDRCQRWFHGKCVNLDQEAGDALDSWLCPSCCTEVDSVNAANKGMGAAIHVEMNSQAVVAESATALLPESSSWGMDNVSGTSENEEDSVSIESPHAPDIKKLWPPFGMPETTANQSSNFAVISDAAVLKAALRQYWNKVQESSVSNKCDDVAVSSYVGDKTVSLNIRGLGTTAAMAVGGLSFSSGEDE